MQGPLHRQERAGRRRSALAVRSRQLEIALAVFAKEAGARLQADLDAGAEVSFELTARSARRGPRLFCYQPLTGEFVRERWAPLRRLPSYGTAVALLEGFDGIDRYLLAREAPMGARGPKPRHRAGGPRADAALRALIEDLFAEQSSFEVRDERLVVALERLDCAAHSSPAEVTLLATLHGLTISSPELALAPGLTLALAESLRGVPEEALAPSLEDGGGEACGEAGRLLVAFTAEDADVLGALARGREVLGELLRALRLFGDGRVTLGRLAWARVGDGGWGARALGWGGRPHGMLVVSAEQEDELRAFCNLVSRRTPRESELAWALGRFERGCERASEYEALSDYLLALRALLDPPERAAGHSDGAGFAGGPAGLSEGAARLFEDAPGGVLAARLAALCALPAERAALAQRVGQAFALERAVIAGAAVEHAGGDALVRELANHLRALLRDVICGHLDPDLVALADELIARAEPAGAGGRGANDADLHDAPADEAVARQASGEEMLGDPVQTAEIVDVLI
jgi:hypothetical protein